MASPSQFASIEGSSLTVIAAIHVDEVGADVEEAGWNINEVNAAAGVFLLAIEELRDGVVDGVEEERIGLVLSPCAEGGAMLVRETALENVLDDRVVVDFIGLMTHAHSLEGGDEVLHDGEAGGFDTGAGVEGVVGVRDVKFATVVGGAADDDVEGLEQVASVVDVVGLAHDEVEYLGHFEAVPVVGEVGPRLRSDFVCAFRLRHGTRDAPGHGQQDAGRATALEHLAELQGPSPAEHVRHPVEMWWVRVIVVVIGVLGVRETVRFEVGVGLGVVRARVEAVAPETGALLAGRRLASGQGEAELAKHGPDTRSAPGHAKHVDVEETQPVLVERFFVVMAGHKVIPVFVTGLALVAVVGTLTRPPCIPRAHDRCDHRRPAHDDARSSRRRV
mmetsp:Transcript_27107/g.83238  ORF Transcript_27107/g.83238 Transcript_27107/m.83238 type:complete len:390 (+) Transcript_27107:125-1294(+)